MEPSIQFNSERIDSGENPAHEPSIPKRMRRAKGKKKSRMGKARFISLHISAGQRLAMPAGSAGNSAHQDLSTEGSARRKRQTNDRKVFERARQGIW